MYLRAGPFAFVQYGRGAMHYGTDIQTPWGWLCFGWPIRCFGRWWPWYVWFTPDATPPDGKRSWRNWGIGPGCWAH